MVASTRRALVRLLTRLEAIPATRPIADALLRRLFDAIAHDWEKIRADPQHREAFTAALVQLPRIFPQLSRPPIRILDVACGTGLASAILHERFPAAHVVGVDLSPRMVDTARMIVPGVEFTVAPASALPFADGAFDLVVSVDGVFDEHELARMIAPGGALLITYTLGGTTPVARPLTSLGSVFTAAGLTASLDEGDVWTIWAMRPSA